MKIILKKLDEILEYVKETNLSRWVDINEVSELSSVSKSTIRRNMKKGTLKYSNVTGKTLFKMEEVESWLNNKEGV